MNDVSDRRLEEKARRRAEILDAAEAVAAEVGVEAMTMDLVARSARLSRALVYVYFNDKPDLLMGICERALDLLQRRFEEATARPGNGLQQVTACGRAYVAFAKEFPVYFDALAHHEAQTPDATQSAGNEQACKRAGNRVHGVMVRAIERGIADGSVRVDAAPLLTAVTLWGFMHGALQLASTKANVLAQDGVSASQLLDHALLLATRSVARQP